MSAIVTLWAALNQYNTLSSVSLSIKVSRINNKVLLEKGRFDQEAQHRELRCAENRVHIPYIEFKKLENVDFAGWDWNIPGEINFVDTVTVDATVPCVARPLAAMVLITCDSIFQSSTYEENLPTSGEKFYLILCWH